MNTVYICTNTEIFDQSNRLLFVSLVPTTEMVRPPAGYMGYKTVILKKTLRDFILLVQAHAKTLRSFDLLLYVSKYPYFNFMAFESIYYPNVHKDSDCNLATRYVRALRYRTAFLKRKNRVLFVIKLKLNSCCDS